MIYHKSSNVCREISAPGGRIQASNDRGCAAQPIVALFARMRMETRRAQRLLMSVQMSYRTPGDDEWLSGRVRNISESGVMFAPADLRVGQGIEVILSTPIPIQSIAAGQLFFSAKVVRTGPDHSAAAQFEDCRFLLGT
jgi:hypothetical protein